MPAKRQSFLGKLEHERPAQPVPVHPEPTHDPGLASAPKYQRTTINIPTTAFNRLREIAFTERRPLNELYLEGIDRVIENRGHPERALIKPTS